MNWLDTARHWLAVHVGIGSSPTAVYWYSLWSGAGSDIGELAIVGGLIHMARAATCHQHGCWRIARHPVGDGTIRVCGKHHPAIDGPILAEHVAAAHAGMVGDNRVTSEP